MTPVSIKLPTLHRLVGAIDFSHVNDIMISKASGVVVQTKIGEVSC